MRYREFDAPERLRPYVRCLWILEDADARGPGRVERVLPDGCVELIVHYGDAFTQRIDDVDRTQPGAVVAGQIEAAMLIRSTGAVGMIGARLHPWAARPFVLHSLDELTGRVAPLDELWGSAAARLQERIHAARDDRGRADVLCDALQSMLPDRAGVHPALAASLGWIEAGDGGLPVEEIARRLQWSRRRLQRHFRSGVGLTPKSFSRIKRFQRVVQTLQDGTPPPLALLAMHAGYADQAHMAREFRRLAGVTITGFLSEQHELSDLLTQAPDEPRA